MTSNAAAPFVPSKRKIHRRAGIEDETPGSWPLVITPAGPWYYAVEYPVSSRERPAGAATVIVDITVLKGEVGIACMAAKNAVLCQTSRKVEDGYTRATLTVDDFSRCRSLMIRNGAGASRSVAQIHNVTVLSGDRLERALSPGNEEASFAWLRIRHNNAFVADEGGSAWPLVVTPVPDKTAALEFSASPHQLSRGPARVSMDVTVLTGEVSVAWTTWSTRTMAEIFCSAGPGRTTVTFTLPDLSLCRSLLLRNASKHGRSVVQIHGIEVSFDGIEADPAPGQTQEADLFSPDERNMHPDSSVIFDSAYAWPLVITSPVQWDHAVGFPATRPAGAGRLVEVTVELTVIHGAVGVGCLDGNQDLVYETFRSVEDGRCKVTFLLRDASKCRQLIVRNTSAAGRSLVQLHDISTSFDVETPTTPTLVIKQDTFARYPRWSGVVPPGFTGDWLGVMTRGDVEGSKAPEEFKRALQTERHGSYPPPTGSELLMDWEPMLAAIEMAGPKFTAVALGAGWGRWIVGGAFAAMKRGRDYHIVGVEAEPQHFRWMQRHLQDNGIPPEKSRLIHAAANSYTGTCWFMVGNSTEWYGQAVVSDAQYQSEDFQREIRESGGQAEAMPCVDLNEVFAGLERVDYLHMDIQGSEAEVLLACPDLLDERVAMVNVGTHSESIERQLRRHFTEHGWQCRYDVPMNSTFPAALEGNEPAQISVGDGVFVWVNPRVVGPIETEPYVVPPLVYG